MLQLTQNEIDFLMMAINYDNVEAQLQDNYSNAGMEEATKLMGSKHAGAGLLGSLTAKGIGNMDDEGYDIFWLNSDKLREIYQSLEL